MTKHDETGTDDQAEGAMPKETDHGADSANSHAGGDSGNKNGEGMDLEDFSREHKEAEKEARYKSGTYHKAVGMDALYESPVRITAVIGNATMPVSQLVKLGRGAVVELNRKLGDAVDIYANNRLIARGEVVVVDDEHIGVTMTEILSASPANKP